MKIEPTECYSAEWLRYEARVHRRHRRIIFIDLRVTARRHNWLPPKFYKTNDDRQWLRVSYGGLAVQIKSFTELFQKRP